MIELVQNKFLIADAPKRRRSEIDAVVFHRIDNGSNGAEIAAFFASHPEVLGTALMPYTFTIPAVQPSASTFLIEQNVPLYIRTPHACKWNSRAIGVGVIGDFRKTPPSRNQTHACVWLAGALQLMFPERRLIITVHSALTTGTTDPAKLAGGKQECPGSAFNDTLKQAQAQAEAIWLGKGFTL